MQMDEKNKKAAPGHAVVIGAGIVGVCCALALQRTGWRVSLLEPGEPGGEQAASYGNGGWLSPSSVVPMSMPGLWKKVPGYLLDRNGPLVIRWSALPRLAPWLLRFVKAGATVPRVEATARALSALLHDSPQRHAALAAQAGVSELIRHDGLLYIYPSRAEFEAEALAWRLRRDNGVVWEEWDEATLHTRVPALSSRYRFGAWVSSGGNCQDPGAYVAALARLAEAQGAQRVRGRALGFVFDGDRLRAVRTEAGLLDCDLAVVAAGVHSKVLARAAGDRVPLESERGYHVELSAAAGALPMPVMPSDGKMANASMDGRLRIAGQVELASVAAPPDWRRVEVLMRHARSSYPDVTRLPADTPQRHWMGHRPSTPDGRPVIGRSQRAPQQVLYAFGHGHVGLASGPTTGQLVAELAGGQVPSLDLAPYSPQRFA